MDIIESLDTLPKIFSFGGGVQSMGALVLASQGVIYCDEFVFSNVGEDSENPDTLIYFREYAMPFAQEHNIKLTEIQRHVRGKPVTIYGQIMGPLKSIVIPVKLSTGAPGNRSCTADFKVRTIARYVRDTYNVRRYIAMIGISIDEIQRARTEREQKIVGTNVVQLVQYPLIDLHYSRNKIIKLISDAGLPVPPKSSCYFCPFHTTSEWYFLKNSRPDLFKNAVKVERRIHEKYPDDLKYMHRSLIPLDKAIEDQMVLPGFNEELEVCEEGYCMV